MNPHCKIAVFILFFIHIFIEGFSQQEAVVIGIVRDATSKEKLPGVTITIDDTTGTTTDLSGRYELKTTPGSHQLTFHFIGYKTVSKSVILDSMAARILNIDLISSSTELGTVVVSASKFEQRLEDVTVSMAVLKPDIIQNTNTTSMDDALNQVPGVTVIDGQANIRGGSGFSYGAGSRVMMLVDDMPMLTADAGDVKWSFLPVENLEQVEVIKGAASALYGSSAMNGIVNVRTAYPKSEPETKINMYAGFYDAPANLAYKWWNGNDQTINGFNFSHSRKIGNLDLVIGGNVFSDDGYRQGEYEKRYRANINTRYSFKNTLEGLSVGINGNIQRAKGGSFFIWQDDSTGALIPMGGIDTATTTISEYVTIRENIDPFISYLSKNGSLYKIRGRYFRTDNNNNTQQQSFADNYFGEAQYQKSFKEWELTFTSGLAYTYNKVKSELYEDHKSENTAIYAQIDKVFINRINFSLGGRLESNGIDSGKIESKPVFRSGINAEVLKYTHIRASYGQGYRFPSIAEKFIRTQVGPLVIYPNDSLQSETGWSAEAAINQGFKISDWKGSIDVAYFWMEYNDMMEFTFGQYGKIEPPTFGIGFKSLNIGNTRINGVDVTLSGEGKLGNIPLTLLCGYTYINPIQLDFDPKKDTLFNSANYNVLKYRYKHTFKGDAEATFLNLIVFGVSVRYTSFMENIDGYAFYTFIPGIEHYRDIHKVGDWVFDNRIIFKLTSQIDLGLITKNVFNHEYVGRPADMQPPRTFTIQARIKF